MLLAFLLGLLCWLLRRVRLAVSGILVDPVAAKEEDTEKKGKEETEKKVEEVAEKIKEDERQKEREKKREAELEKIVEEKRNRREERERNQDDREDDEAVTNDGRRGLLESFGFHSRPSPSAVRLAAASRSHGIFSSHWRGPVWGCREEEIEEEMEMQEMVSGNIQEGGSVPGEEGEETEVVGGEQELVAGGGENEIEGGGLEDGIEGDVQDYEAADKGQEDEGEDEVQEDEGEGDGQEDRAAGGQHDDMEGEEMDWDEISRLEVERDGRTKEGEQVEAAVEGGGQVEVGGEIEGVGIAGEEGEDGQILEQEEEEGEESVAIQDEEDSYINIVRESGTDEVEETEEEGSIESSSSSRTGTLSLASTLVFTPVAHSTAIGMEDLPPLPSSSSSSASATPEPAEQPPLPYDQHEVHIGKMGRPSPRKLTPYPVGASRPYLLRSDVLKKRAEERAAKTEAEIRAKIMAAAVKAKVVPAAEKKE